ncbi:MAG: hypothetical protein KGH60_04305 [Candidatus Micrarchaeota archaeon]|nr:hypothetical protein [Candidatus Micrarchaeota archaeon]
MENTTKKPVHIVDKIQTQLREDGYQNTIKVSDALYRIGYDSVPSMMDKVAEGGTIEEQIGKYLKAQKLSAADSDDDFLSIKSLNGELPKNLPLQLTIPITFTLSSVTLRAPKDSHYKIVIDASKGTVSRVAEWELEGKKICEYLVGKDKNGDFNGECEESPFFVKLRKGTA